MLTNVSSTRPPFAGRTYEAAYDELTALNAYADDGETMRYEILTGPYQGATGEIRYRWNAIGDGVFVISWQETDGATVVHVDDFSRGTSQSFFTTPALEFLRMQGSLTPR